MNKLKPMIKRIVERNVEESEIKKQIEDLKRQRSEITEELEFYRRFYAGEFNEPDVAPDPDDYNDEESGEWSEVFDNEMEREIG